MPLTSGDIDQALLPPNAQQIRNRLRSFHNPLIHSNEIDFDRGLSPADAAVVAVAVNPALTGIRDGRTLSKAQRLQNTLVPNPQLTYSLDVPFGSNSSGNVSGYGVGLQWEITSVIAHSAKVQAADKLVEQNRLDVAWEEWQFAEAARQAAFDVIALRSQLAAARELSARLNQFADRVEKAVEQRQVTAVDASAANAAASDSRVTVAELERDLRDADFALNRAIGFPPNAPVRLSSSVTLPSQLHIFNEDMLLAYLEEHRIDLVALRVGYQSQEASVRAAILGQFPKITLGISNTQDYGNFLTLGPQLSVDLPVFDHNQGVIAIEQATRQQLRDEYIQRVFEARSDVSRAVAAIEQLNPLIENVAAEVKALHTLLDTEDRALQEGNLDLNTYFASAVTLAQKQTDLGKLKQDLIHAKITLELAAGVYLPDVESATTQFAATQNGISPSVTTQITTTQITGTQITGTQITGTGSHR